MHLFDFSLGHALNKRRILTIALIVCCIAVLSAGTIAFFSVEDTAYNVITTGKIAMKLHEDKADGTAFENIEDAMPGQKVDKIVYVSNEGNSGMFVRASMTYNLYDADGTEMDWKYIKLDINTVDWTEEYGYYYYNKVLTAGQMTEPLLRKVSFDIKMPNEYQGCEVRINVNAQAVQSKNNGGSALTAAGWPEN